MPSTLFLRSPLFGQKSDSPRLNVEESAEQVAKKAADQKLIELNRQGGQGKLWISVNEILGVRDSD